MVILVGTIFCMKTILSPLFLLIISQSSYSQLVVPDNIDYSWKTDTTKHTVDLEEFDVVMSRYSFPTLDYPTFVDLEEGLKECFIHEPVIAVSINGEAKAYPLNMLTMHEMSNDSCGSVPILPTFCSLCNSSVVFDRRLKHNGKDYLLEFEVSGMLRHSDMVMVDKQTETWWQQLMGEGMVGELAGAELDIVSSMVLSVEEFFNRYPNGKIMSHHTGGEVEKMYGHNPYVHYDSAGHKPYEKYFDAKTLDPRLQAMERIIAIKGGDHYKIYPFTAITEEVVINDAFDHKKIVIFFETGTVSVLDEDDISKSKVIGTATVFESKIDGKELTFKSVDGQFVDNQTKSIWNITGQCTKGLMKGKELYPANHTNHFAFAWLSFNPESLIYGQD